MARRIAVLCEHGWYGRHLVREPRPIMCKGGRVLTEGEYVLIEKVDGLWPLWAYSTLNEGSSIDSILDALAGGES